MGKLKKLMVCFLSLMFILVSSTVSAEAASKIRMNKSSLTLCRGNSYKLDVSGTSKKEKWYTSNKRIVTVSKYGTVKAKRSGKVTITAKIGSKKYRCKITVTKAYMNYSKKTIYYKKKYRLKVRGTSKKVRGWTSSDKKVAVVSKYGTVKGVSAGKAIIRAKIGHGYVRCIVTVKAGKHSHKYVSKVTKNPTCVEKGNRRYTCSICHKYYDRAISALGHTYSNGICTRCGSRSDGQKVIGEADDEKITLAFYNAGKKNSGKAKIVRVKANQYLSLDRKNGVSAKDNVKGTIVGYYNCGTNTKVTIDRYTKDHEDNIYSKYYVVKDNAIIAGPVYVSDVASKWKYHDVDIKSKKGVFSENSDTSYAEDLGCSYTTINIDLRQYIYPNETPDGEITDNIKKKAYVFKSNGKTYYFSKDKVDMYDKWVKAYTDKGISVTLILSAPNTEDWKEYPYELTYGKDCKAQTLMAFNTASEKGRDYWIAIMEFLGSRYSREDWKYGYVSNYIVGNEIDYPSQYYKVSKGHADLDSYMEEYYRTLRLTSLAISKYGADITVTAPFTHAWAKDGYSVINHTSTDAYAPKDMIDWLNKISKQEGDFNWGIAPHCYGNSLPASWVAQNDTHPMGGRKDGMTGDYKTSTQLTFSNLEILDEYLNQSNMKYKGKTRKVYLTEAGVSTYQNREEDKKNQAVYAASAYFKVANLDSITAFSYYRLKDHPQEVASMACFALIDEKGNKKPAYEVWKYIDTQYAFKAADPYLPAFRYCDDEGTWHSVADKNLSSYKDTMRLFKGTFDWSKHWDESKIKKRTVAKVEDYEDKEYLGGISFTDESYLYDGKEHELTVTGKVADGITVKYENNKRTEKGSSTAKAVFYKGEEIVGTRTAVLKIADMITNKTVYENGEDIFVTAKTDNKTDWIGIYRKGDKLDKTEGGVDSVYWYYPAADGKYSGNTYSIQKNAIYNPSRPEYKELPEGEYTVYFLKNDGYDVMERQDIKVLSPGESSKTQNLSKISFEDKVVAYDEKEHELLINGELPSGITVKYENNKLTEVGSTKATVQFIKSGKVIESRTATLTIQQAEKPSVKTDKTTYIEGENVMVTAVGMGTDWVGIYAADDVVKTDESIYWYYVADSKHESGKTYNIKEQEHNPSRDALKDLPAGKYKVVLMDDGGYDILAETAITIQPKDKIDLSDVSFSDKTFLYDGEQHEITVDGTLPDGVTVKYTDHTRTEIGTTQATATFYKGEEVVGTKSAAIKVSNMMLNKETYESGEKIFVSANTSDSTDWIGIYKKGEKVDPNDGGAVSIYWYYPKNSGNTYAIQDVGEVNAGREDLKDLPAGEYTVYLLKKGGYEVEAQQDITILEEGKSSGLTNLSNIKFVDQSVEYDGKEHAIEIQGTLPEGVTVKYEKNTRTEVGTTQAKADFVKAGKVIETRYAILTVKSNDLLKTDKDIYTQGEDIMVTAKGSGSDWVGIYRKDDVVGASGVPAIYWYNVASDGHTSGTAYAINKETFGTSREDYKNLPAGEYKILLLENGGYNILAQKNITIK